MWAALGVVTALIFAAGWTWFCLNVAIRVDRHLSEEDDD